LDQADEDVNKDLDLVMFMRRIKMHGLGLTILLKSDNHAFLSSFSRKKNIETLTEGPRKHWNEIESLTYSDRIAAGFFARYKEMEADDDRDRWFDKRIKSHMI